MCEILSGDRECKTAFHIYESQLHLGRDNGMFSKKTPNLACENRIYLVSGQANGESLLFYRLKYWTHNQNTSI